MTKLIFSIIFKTTNKMKCTAAFSFTATNIGIFFLAITTFLKEIIQIINNKQNEYPNSKLTNKEILLTSCLISASRKPKKPSSSSPFCDKFEDRYYKIKQSIFCCCNPLHIYKTSFLYLY